MSRLVGRQSLVVAVIAGLGECIVIAGVAANRCSECENWVLGLAILYYSAFVGFGVGIVAVLLERAVAGVAAAPVGAVVGSALGLAIVAPSFRVTVGDVATQSFFLGAEVLVCYVVTAAPLGGLLWLSRRDGTVRVPPPTNWDPSGDRICPECGRRVAPDRLVLCNNCGADLKEYGRHAAAQEGKHLGDGETADH
jgi:hypothetical protein